VTLTSVGNSTAPIALGADTSGFLAAVKLDGTAASTLGGASGSAFDVALAEMSEYNGVSAGTLTVAGQQIAIDPATLTLGDLVSTLDGLAGVDASLDAFTGAIRISSSSTSTPLTVSDDSGLLGILGISSGTFAGRAEQTVATQVADGMTIVSNGRNVAAAAATAAAELTAAFSELAKAGDGDRDFLRALASAASDAASALRDGGLAGFTVGGSDETLRLVVDEEALTAALDALADPRSAAGKARAALDDLAGRVAAAADEARERQAAAAPPPAPQTLSRAQLVADQAAAALLFMQALERAAGPPNREERPADPAGPSRGALDLESRLRIRDQIRSDEEPVGLEGLFDRLTLNERPARSSRS
jgi:hypothetical protein